MSADNWARCPRCMQREIRQVDAQSAEVSELYGSVSVEEFDKARKAVTEKRAALANFPHKFREDYEFYGAEAGTVTVSYHGECQDCGLELTIQEDHEIPGWTKP